MQNALWRPLVVAVVTTIVATGCSSIGSPAASSDTAAISAPAGSSVPSTASPPSGSPTGTLPVTSALTTEFCGAFKKLGTIPQKETTEQFAANFQKVFNGMSRVAPAQIRAATTRLAKYFDGLVLEVTFLHPTNETFKRAVATATNSKDGVAVLGYAKTHCP